ncbi:MAG: hypothetical protein ACKOUT_03810 [Novosphingobium sp.]
MGLLAGVISALIVAFVMAQGWISLPSKAPSASPVVSSATPATDYVDRYRCRSGLTKLVMMRGVEDGFLRQGNEKSVPRDALLRMEYFSGLYNETPSKKRWRDFDEIGVDKILADHFVIPRKIVSGALVMRIQSEAGSENDYVILGDIEQDVRKPHPERTTSFLARLAGKSPDAQGLLSLDFAEFTPPPDNASAGGLLDYLNMTDRTDDVDFVVQDDTAVDVAALILCQQPIEARGTTLREFRSHPFGDGVSFLACGQDRTQAECNPLAGDMQCRRELPLACYHSGNGQPPASVQTALGGLGRHFVDGEVRLTPAVAGERFPSLSDANGFCAANFGEGWRVLSYHEGGGGNVISRSRIAPLSRAWIDIRDQRYGNCWDRDKER